MDIKRLEAAEAWEILPKLMALLKDSVDNGASIGFLPPLSLEDARLYWEKRIKALEAGEVWLFVAEVEGHVVGTAQLAPEPRENGRHRAEVQKVMSHSSYRRQGIASALMQAIEITALERQLRLLILDTRRGDASELLYQAMGYQIAGVIPQYVISEDGNFDDTVIYYKLLGG